MLKAFEGNIGTWVKGDLLVRTEFQPMCSFPLVEDLASVTFHNHNPCLSRFDKLFNEIARCVYCIKDFPLIPPYLEAIVENLNLVIRS